MWQIALAAALAGSGFFATRLFNTDPDKQIDKRSDLSNNPLEYGFEFSSPDNGSKKKGAKGRGKKWGKVVGIMGKCETRVLEQKNNCNKKSGKGLGFCVKKRRISKFGPGKCDSCSSKGNAVFSRGIGVGIMCMMSAGKNEINKLNASMDKTAKVVHELKYELLKKKEAHNRQVSSSKHDINSALEESRDKSLPLLQQPSAEFRYNVENYSECISKDGECARYILPEESQGEVMEIDLLEAEFESEMQKLSWGSSDASVPEETRLDCYENDASTEGVSERDSELLSSFLSNGVVPSVLNQKLSSLLIKQQEGQIVELESELHEAQSKLLERETELQALKDCVRRMSQFSITNASDEETEKQVEEEKINEYCTKIGSETNRPVVGMKRAMSFGSYSCHVTSLSN